uniref:NTR domain-containing protein n=1 Tax=Acrobeloides nanus TaxID=290746 RepID=A0A914C0W1_9BILA
MRTFVLACAFAAIIASAYAACSCSKQPTTAQEAFCAADWVMQASIFAETFNKDRTEITYHVTRQGLFYKWPESRKEPFPLTVVSSTSADDCGEPKLFLGISYLLIGTFDSEGRMIINSCLTMPKKDGTASPSAAQFWLLPLQVRNNLLLKKFTCDAAEATAQPNAATAEDVTRATQTTTPAS